VWYLSRIIKMSRMYKTGKVENITQTKRAEINHKAKEYSG
jgi:hypothetical protein